MHAATLQLPPCFGDQNPYLLDLPAQHACEESETVRFASGHESLTGVETQLPELLIFRPSGDRNLRQSVSIYGMWIIRNRSKHLIDVIGHILEPCVDQLLLLLGRHIHLLAQFRARLVDECLQLNQVRRLLQRVVVGLDPHLKLLHLDPPARLDASEGLRVQLRPVRHTTGEIAAVDEVVRSGPVFHPLSLDVVDHERQIRRDPARLDGAEIGSHNLRARKPIGKVNRPDASPGAQVQHMVRAGQDWSAEQLPVEGQHADVVKDVLPFLFLLVIREHVLALAIAVVSTPVLVFVVQHAGRERSRVALGLGFSQCRVDLTGVIGDRFDRSVWIWRGGLCNRCDCGTWR